MKKLLLFVVVFLLALTVVSAQRVDVGDVDIWNDDFYLYVKYTAQDNWAFEQTDLRLGDSKRTIFETTPYEEMHENATSYTYKILLANAPEKLYVVAEATINHPEHGLHNMAWDLGEFDVKIDHPLSRLKDYLLGAL